MSALLLFLTENKIIYKRTEISPYSIKITPNKLNYTDQNFQCVDQWKVSYVRNYDKPWCAIKRHFKENTDCLL